MKIKFLMITAFFFGMMSPSSHSADWDEEEKVSAPYPYPVPLGLKAPYVPQDNPMTFQKVELGKFLYFDPRLSRDNTVSCATCHDPKKGWTDQSVVSTGINGQKGTVNSPPVFNAVYFETQFWDGRAKSLEEQAKGPIENPIEMGFTHEEVVKKLSKIKGYRKLFKEAFGDKKITIDRIAKAIASFERTILLGDAPIDRYNAGDKEAIGESAERGLALFFGKANCNVCHSGPNFSNSEFHNLGIGIKKEKPDLGRFNVTQEEQHKGAFKTPGLRNLSLTAPYMHDGSHATLREVIDFYNKGGEENPNLDRDIRPLKLSEEEITDLLAFLDSLESDPIIVDPPKKFPK